MERDAVAPDRRRVWERRAVMGLVAYASAAAGVLVVAAVILLVVAFVRGNGDPGERIDFSDFEGGIFSPGDVDTRSFFATCPPGRLLVEFQPDEEIRITRGDGRFLASLDTKDASVNCSGALEDGRGRGFYVRGVTRPLTRATTLECIVDRPIDLIVHAIFRWETDVYGGFVGLGTVGIRTPRADVYPGAFVMSSFTEDGRSYLHYRRSVCRVAEG